MSTRVLLSAWSLVIGGFYIGLAWCVGTVLNPFFASEYQQAGVAMSPLTQHIVTLPRAIYIFVAVSIALLVGAVGLKGRVTVVTAVNAVTSLLLLVLIVLYIVTLDLIHKPYM